MTYRLIGSRAATLLCAGLLGSCGSQPVAETTALIASVPPDQPNPAVAPITIGAKIDAYSESASVQPGGIIEFHVSDNGGSTSTARTGNLTITRMGQANRQVYASAFQMRKQTIPGNAWVNCCNWPVTVSLPVPASWDSGLYWATFSSPDNAQARVYFVVRAANPGSTSKTVLQIPFDTAQAYSDWGGKSLYVSNTGDNTRAPVVSRTRPTGIAQKRDFERWAMKFIRWAESQQIVLEYVAGSDLNRLPGLLAPYQLFVDIGHDEYWSASMRAELQRFVSAGGNVALFSGNNMWWKTELMADRQGRSEGYLRCTKTAGTSTYKWFETDPESALLGSSFVRGGFVNSIRYPERTRIGYVVQRPTHWVFAGTGLAAGASFGQPTALLAYEADGIDFTLDAQGLPRPTGTDGAPVATTILATSALAGWESDSALGPKFQKISLTGQPGAWAAMTIHQQRGGGGVVFNAATTEWAAALPECMGAAAPGPICVMTRNVLATLRDSGARP